MAITPSHLLASLRLGCQGQLNFRPPGPSDPSNALSFVRRWRKGFKGRKLQLVLKLLLK